MTLYDLTKLSTESFNSLIWIMSLSPQSSRMTCFATLLSVFRYHQLFDADEERILKDEEFLKPFIERCIENDNYCDALIETLNDVYGEEMMNLITTKRTNLLDDLFALRPDASSVINKYKS